MAYFKPPLLPKLRLPGKGPPEQPRPEPVPHVIPHSTEHVAPKPPKIWRIAETDLIDICPWLVPALQEKNPKLEPDRVVYWLRVCMNERSAYLIRSKNICSLDIIDKDGLDTSPVMNEKWCKGNKQALKEEFQELYLHRANYAKSLGVGKFNYGFNSDAAMLHVTEVLPNSQKYNVYVKAFRD